MRIYHFNIYDKELTFNLYKQVDWPKKHFVQINAKQISMSDLPQNLQNLITKYQLLYHPNKSSHKEAEWLCVSKGCFPAIFSGDFTLLESRTNTGLEKSYFRLRRFYPIACGANKNRIVNTPKPSSHQPQQQQQQQPLLPPNKKPPGYT